MKRTVATPPLMGAMIMLVSCWWLGGERLAEAYKSIADPGMDKLFDWVDGE